MRRHWISILVLCLLTIGALLLSLRSANARATRAGMIADSLVATLDTLRVYHIDALTYWERRVVQTEIDRTRLERELRRKPAVVLRPVLHIDTLRIVDTVEVQGDSIRTATFTRYQPPVTLTALVAMSSRAATLDATMALDTIPLGIRIQCGEGRVRPVTAQISTPAWVTLRMGTPQAAPEVCNAPRPRRGLPWWSVLVGVTGGLLLR
jgi:hypothetical protein